MSNRWADDSEGPDNHESMQAVPSHWTTLSGKFDPKKSHLGFDAESNVAINVNLHGTSSDESVYTSSNGSEYSPSNTSNDDPNAKPKSYKSTKVGSDDEILEGEIEDPVQRHHFYKKLRKAGIKKTFTIDEDWDNSSQYSTVSEISVGNASYILDLAQQKESRKKDREEEALEEALDLYGTWLTEGKNDDKNIFMMILNEVKKEQKLKSKKADKRHAELLDAALDEELKRRERIKKERDEEERANAAAAAASQKKESEPKRRLASGDSFQKLRSNSCHASRSFGNSRKSETKISAIITSQRELSYDHGSSCEGSHGPDDSLEPSEPSESTQDHEHEISIIEPSKPSSRASRGLFSRFSSKNVTEPSRSKSESHINKNSVRPSKEESKRVFSRLRRQLSERQFEQWKEEEKSWKKNDHVITNEEKWWKKINDAKKGDLLFVQSTDPLLTPQIVGYSLKNPSSSDINLNRRRVSGTSTIKSTDTSSTPPAIGTNREDEEKKLSFSKKKKIDKPKKKKQEKKESESIGSSSMGSDQGPKTKDKKKKKKSKLVEGDEGFMDLNDKEENNSAIKKKKERKSGRVLDVIDESEGKSPKTGKKKKSKSMEVSGTNVVEIPSPTKKKKKKVNSLNITMDEDDGAEPAKLLKKKKKKKSLSAVSSSSADHSVQGDHKSVDWTDRCIVASQSEETGSETVVTMESGLR